MISGGLVSGSKDEAEGKLDHAGRGACAYLR